MNNLANTLSLCSTLSASVAVLMCASSAWAGEVKAPVGTNAALPQERTEAMPGLKQPAPVAIIRTFVHAVETKDRSPQDGPRLVLRPLYY